MKLINENFPVMEDKKTRWGTALRFFFIDMRLLTEVKNRSVLSKYPTILSLDTIGPAELIKVDPEYAGFKITFSRPAWHARRL